MDRLSALLRVVGLLAAAVALAACSSDGGGGTGGDSPPDAGGLGASDTGGGSSDTGAGGPADTAGGQGGEDTGGGGGECLCEDGCDEQPGTCTSEAAAAFCAEQTDPDDWFVCDCAELRAGADCPEGQVCGETRCIPALEGDGPGCNIQDADVDGPMWDDPDPPGQIACDVSFGEGGADVWVGRDGEGSLTFFSVELAGVKPDGTLDVSCLPPELSDLRAVDLGCGYWGRDAVRDGYRRNVGLGHPGLELERPLYAGESGVLWLGEARYRVTVGEAVEYGHRPFSEGDARGAGIWVGVKIEAEAEPEPLGCPVDGDRVCADEPWLLAGRIRDCEKHPDCDNDCCSDSWPADVYVRVQNVRTGELLEPVVCRDEVLRAEEAGGPSPNPGWPFAVALHSRDVGRPGDLLHVWVSFTGSWGPPPDCYARHDVVLGDQGQGCILEQADEWNGCQ